MSLPELIEIIPLDKPVHAEITVPGSKSITNRALLLAALAEGETTLQGALWSEDTRVMIECLQELGFMVNVAPDPEEPCNRTITVYGKGGAVPPGGTAEQPLELFVGNAGTAARFLAAFVCLGRGVYRLHGVPRMHERPQAALFQALRELGYRIESPNNKLPALIHGGGPRPGKCSVSIEASSQFASALLLASKIGKWTIEVIGASSEEQPYVEMTRALLEAFSAKGGHFRVEPDASSGSYFVAAQWMLRHRELALAIQKIAAHQEPGSSPVTPVSPKLSTVRVIGWPTSGWQIDANFLGLVSEQAMPLAAQPGGTTIEPYGAFLTLPNDLSREHDLGDSIMTAAVLAPAIGRMIVLKDLGRLRLQESERVGALRCELTKCGAKVIEQGDTLTILPSTLHGAEIETYGDHRMAMCFAILGLKVPGIKIKNPSCVKKTFPNFFQKLAAAPPRGLGATIREVRTGRVLGMEELFADSQ